MRVLDTFPFSEPHELEVLLVKLNLESDLVAEWVIVENTYTLRGEWKGLSARALIAREPRLAPFRDRITVIEADRPVRRFEDSRTAEAAAFVVERWQRDLARQHIADHYGPDDWILVTDVDESIDATDRGRRAELLARMEGSDGYLHVSVRLHWYDFDNQFLPLYGIPLIKLDQVTEGERSLSQIRAEHSGFLEMDWRQVIGFHYSSCYPFETIVRKLRTQAHTGITEDELRQALRANHRPMSAELGRVLSSTPEDLFETVTLDESNSPAYVRERLATLRTGNVDPLYRQNRSTDYPGLTRRRPELRRRVRLVGSALRAKAIYAVRRCGWRDFKRSSPPAVPSPWLDA